VKPVEQWGAMANGSLDMSLYPLAYAGGRVPELNIGLMPALVTSYEQGLRWKDAPIGKELTRIVEEKGVKIITWVWQAGGIASRAKPVISPDDVKGLKFRGGSKEMDVMLKAAGASPTNVPSSEIYSAMQSGVLDAALTSSTSLISFRLHEHAKHVTTARDKTFWFMFEPIMMSKATFDKLTPDAAEDRHGSRRRAWRSSAWMRPRPTTRSWPRSYKSAGDGVRHERGGLRQVARGRPQLGLEGLRGESAERQEAARDGRGRQVSMALRPAWRAFAATLTGLNLWLGYLAGVLVAVSAVLLTGEVLAALHLNAPSDWAWSCAS
jgi:hypothetical protein